MTATFLKYATPALFAALSLCGSLRAETTSRTLSGLRNFGPANAPQARIDTLTLTLDPANNVLRGKPGQTIGWGFQLTWASNAGDSINFTDSKLTGDLTDISATGYKDLLGRAAPAIRTMTAGTDRQIAFVAGTQGIGGLTLSPAARPGSTHTGKLRLYFEVKDHTGTAPRTLKSLVLDTDVSVIVEAPDPADSVEQTITFAEIPNQSAGGAPFTLSPVATSNLPVRLLSLQPNVCTVDGTTVTIHSAGSCTIVAEQEGNHAHLPALPVTRTFEVEKVPATVTIVGNLNRAWTGTDQTFTATTVPPGLAVTMLYNGTTTPPRDPGISNVLALITDPSFTGSSSVTLTITDLTPPPLTTYAGWLQTHFTPAQIQAGTLTGHHANPSGDGFNNLVKYAMGFDPMTPLSAADGAALLRMAGSNAGGSVIFEIPATAPSDVTITVEAGSDLISANWQEITRRTGSGAWTGPANVFTGTPNVTGTRVPILVTEPAFPLYNRRFYRLNFLATP